MSEIENQKEHSLRIKLVRSVIEHFVNVKMFEMLDPERLRSELSELMKISLGFDTYVEIDDDPAIIDRSVFSGSVKFMEMPVGNEQIDGFTVVRFQVLPTEVNF